jgi:hypothetical protein
LMIWARLKLLALLSSTPIVADTPLPTFQVYWMLLIPTADS